VLHPSPPTYWLIGKKNKGKQQRTPEIKNLRMGAIPPPPPSLISIPFLCRSLKLPIILVKFFDLNGTFF
jgi:hypothetical protein